MNTQFTTLFITTTVAIQADNVHWYCAGRGRQDISPKPFDFGLFFYNLFVRDVGGLHTTTVLPFDTWAASFIKDTVSEWLRRWTRNPLGSARRGSNPLGVVSACSDFCLSRIKSVTERIMRERLSHINHKFQIHPIKTSDLGTGHQTLTSTSKTPFRGVKATAGRWPRMSFHRTSKTPFRGVKATAGRHQPRRAGTKGVTCLSLGPGKQGRRLLIQLSVKFSTWFEYHCRSRAHGRLNIFQR